MTTKSYWQQFERQRISRRRMLAVSGAGAAGLAVVAACSNKKKTTTSGTTPGTTPSGTPKAGGRFKEATPVISDAIFGLDPHTAVAAGLNYFARMYNVLINRSAVNPDYYYYDLADEKGLETPDEQTFIFTIRPGVMIPENTLGVPSRAMDANDAYATFERIGGIVSGTKLELANSCQFVCQYFAKHVVTDSMHYRVETTVPYAWFLFNIGRAISTIPPKELIADAGKMKTAGVGGGPFQIKPGAFVEGEKVALEKNPLYYRTGKPYMDGWDVTIIPDRVGLRAAFVAKDSYTYGAGTDGEVKELTSSKSVYKASDDPTYTYISFTMNVNKDPWKDPRIRQAAMYAFNRQEFIDRVYQGAAQANGLVHWCVAGALSASDLEKYQPFNPAKSKQLIKAATGKDSISVKVMFSTFEIEELPEHLPIFIEQMKNAGFDVQQDPRDLGSWLGDYRNKTYDASLSLNQIYETAEIPLDFQHSKGPAGSNIYATGVQDPAIDAAIDATKRITNFDERVKAIQDAQKKIYDAGPACLPLVTPYSRTLYWDFVKDVPTGLGTTGLFLTHGIWLNL
jgi:ABC-type transport system substrate-binding protein